MALKPGVKGQIVISFGDQNRNGEPDIEVEGHVPGISQLSGTTGPQDLPIDAALEAMQRLTSKLPMPIGPVVSHAIGMFRGFRARF